MTIGPEVSVVVRAKDEEAGIGRTLQLLAEQRYSPTPEVIVVDSGSTDSTVAIARDHGARIVEMRAEEFTFGRSLNIGCEEASGELVVALSAHAFPTDPEWLSRLAAHFADPRVACASGELHGPDGERLERPVIQDGELARRRPTWGYSNAAGAFRAELWSSRRWREDLPGAEDKDWALHWLSRGHVAVIDPALCVEHDHSHDPLRDQYARARREWRGLAMVLDDEPPYRLRDLAREWWTDRGSHRSHARARLSHRRAARLLGGYAGRRLPRS